jgi:hypothetical protein
MGQKIAIDIDVDWNTQDDTGLPWTFIDEATEPAKIVPGAHVLTGRGIAVAVAEVVDVDETASSISDNSPGLSRITSTFSRRPPRSVHRGHAARP